jgi:hypothetical protein
VRRPFQNSAQLRAGSSAARAILSEHGGRALATGPGFDGDSNNISLDETQRLCAIFNTR